MYDQFTPYGYQQFGQQYNMMPQTSYMHNQQQSTPNMEVVPVPTIQQVEQVGLQPGQRKMVMVQNEPVIAARYADNMGLVTTEYYKLEKFVPGAPSTLQAANYITEEQLEARLSALIDSLKPANSGRKVSKEAAE